MTTKSKTKITPQHQGRKMSLKAFEFAEVEEGYLYELARGYIVVSEFPNFFHTCLVVAIRDALIEYQCANHGQIHIVLGAMDCKLLIPDLESERHPDLAVYLSAPKGKKDRTLWRTWIPGLVIEVVSANSADRDYVEKRQEYWALGIKEYWIVDANLKQVLILKHGRHDWTEKVLQVTEMCETKLLPGFKLPCQAIFAAATEANDED
jgi:Uma2 family endonuclease